MEGKFKWSRYCPCLPKEQTRLYHAVSASYHIINSIIHHLRVANLLFWMKGEPLFSFCPTLQTCQNSCLPYILPEVQGVPIVPIDNLFSFRKLSQEGLAWGALFANCVTKA